jgi:membrane peptidoglycan carboxypeptidase
MIASAVVNGGKLVEPSIVRSITDRKKNLVYSGDGGPTRQVMSPETSQEMMTLMAATISRGTSRRAFKGYRSDRVLSKLSLGGKTGSIKNDTDEWLYDWFVGFAAEKAGTRKLAVAILIIHDELLRTRAQEYARLALRYYFGRSAKVS